MFHVATSKVKIVSGDICRAVEAFKFESREGEELALCAYTSGADGPTIFGKGLWLESTNYCIWGHWRAALEAIHDPHTPGDEHPYSRVGRCRCGVPT